jgi:hypothetical protein
MMLTLTFKESERYIYDEICNHSAKGGWVKDVLAEYIKNNNNTPTKKEVDMDNFLNF